jgi:ribonucleoside-diphosphate reductase alpha chain
MAIEDIGKNALQVLEKRYLAKDAEGNHTEDVAGCRGRGGGRPEL